MTPSELSWHASSTTTPPYAPSPPPILAAGPAMTSTVTPSPTPLTTSSVDDSLSTSTTPPHDTRNDPPPPRANIPGRNKGGRASTASANYTQPTRPRKNQSSKPNSRTTQASSFLHTISDEDLQILYEHVYAERGPVRAYSTRDVSPSGPYTETVAHTEQLWNRAVAKAFPDGRHSVEHCKTWWKERQPLRKGAWTATEDRRTLAIIADEQAQYARYLDSDQIEDENYVPEGFSAEDGPEKWDWQKVAERLVTRTARQCRERYVEYLDPTTSHGPYTYEEDAIIIDAVEKHGHSWRLISDLLVGRRPNSLKNHWNARLSRLYPSCKAGIPLKEFYDNGVLKDTGDLPAKTAPVPKLSPKSRKKRARAVSINEPPMGASSSSAARQGAVSQKRGRASPILQHPKTAPAKSKTAKKRGKGLSTIEVAKNDNSSQVSTQPKAKTSQPVVPKGDMLFSSVLEPRRNTPRVKLPVNATSRFGSSRALGVETASPPRERASTTSSNERYVETYFPVSFREEPPASPLAAAQVLPVRFTSPTQQSPFPTTAQLLGSDPNSITSTDKDDTPQSGSTENDSSLSDPLNVKRPPWYYVSCFSPMDTPTGETHSESDVLEWRSHCVAETPPAGAWAASMPGSPAPAMIRQGSDCGQQSSNLPNDHLLRQAPAMHRNNTTPGRILTSSTHQNSIYSPDPALVAMHEIITRELSQTPEDDKAAMEFAHAFKARTVPSTHVEMRATDDLSFASNSDAESAGSFAKLPPLATPESDTDTDVSLHTENTSNRPLSLVDLSRGGGASMTPDTSYSYASSLQLHQHAQLSSASRLAQAYDYPMRKNSFGAHLYRDGEVPSSCSTPMGYDGTPAGDDQRSSYFDAHVFAQSNDPSQCGNSAATNGGFDELPVLSLGGLPPSMFPAQSSHRIPSRVREPAPLPSPLEDFQPYLLLTSPNSAPCTPGGNSGGVDGRHKRLASRRLSIAVWSDSEMSGVSHHRTPSGGEQNDQQRVVPGRGAAEKAKTDAEA